MNEPLGKQLQRTTGEHPPAPWLAWLPWPGGTLGNPTHRIHEARPAGHIEVSDLQLSERQRAATATQLATSIRMHGIDSESAAMLGLLESLVVAGEIAYDEYFRRVENLFPHQMAGLDQSLKQKILVLVAQ